MNVESAAAEYRFQKPGDDFCVVGPLSRKPLDPVGVADNIFKSVKTSRIIIPDFVAGHEFSAHTQCIPECEAEYGSFDFS